MPCASPQDRGHHWPDMLEGVGHVRVVINVVCTSSVLKRQSVRSLVS